MSCSVNSWQPTNQPLHLPCIEVDGDEEISRRTLFWYFNNSSIVFGSLAKLMVLMLLLDFLSTLLVFITTPSFGSATASARALLALRFSSPLLVFSLVLIAAVSSMTWKVDWGVFRLLKEKRKFQRKTKGWRNKGNGTID